MGADDAVDGEVQRTLDRMFVNQINKFASESLAAYQNANYREAMVSGFWKMQNARDAYRVLLGDSKPHMQVLKLFIDTQTLVLSPVCPHVCEYMWAKMHDDESLAVVGRWPELPEADPLLLQQSDYVEGLLRSARMRMQALQKPKGKKPGMNATKCTIVVGKSFMPDQQHAMGLIKAKYDETNEVPEDWRKVIMAGIEKAKAKTILPFIQARIEMSKQQGPSAFSGSLSFDEQALLNDFRDIFQRELGLQELRVVESTDAGAIEGLPQDRVEAALPGEPFLHFTE
jgi:leucyl-tRNA synthetase